VVLQAPTSEAVKCQAVVDALSTHLSPHVTLEHIQGPDLAAHDTMALKNLLDIFSVLFHSLQATIVEQTILNGSVLVGFSASREDVTFHCSIGQSFFKCKFDCAVSDPLYADRDILKI